MPNVPRPSDSARTRPARSAPKSLDAGGVVAPAASLGAPCVVGGLLRGQPELTLLVKAAHGLVSLDLVDDRLALVSTVTVTRPAALVVPPFDTDRTSTAPLVLRVRREAPGVAVVVISAQPAGAGQPLLRAVQAGARVITSPTAPELQAALAALLESRTRPS